MINVKKWFHLVCVDLTGTEEYVQENSDLEYIVLIVRPNIQIYIKLCNHISKNVNQKAREKEEARSQFQCLLPHNQIIHKILRH